MDEDCPCGTQRCMGPDYCEGSDGISDEEMKQMVEQRNKLLVVNLFAGPGSGKSTTAAGVFHKLKLLGVNCELVTEYAKDKVWDKHHAIFDNQLYVTTKQYHRQFRLVGQVDVAITDSPLLLCKSYNINGPLAQPGVKEHFDAMINGLYDSFNNMNYFIKRVKPYNPKGRYQTEEEARAIDKQLLEMLTNQKDDESFRMVNGDEDAAKIIALEVVKKLNGIA